MVEVIEPTRAVAFTSPADLVFFVRFGWWARHFLEPDTGPVLRVTMRTLAAKGLAPATGATGTIANSVKFDPGNADSEKWGNSFSDSPGAGEESLAMPAIRPQHWFWLAAACLVAGLTAFWSVDLPEVKPTGRESDSGERAWDAAEDSLPSTDDAPSPRRGHDPFGGTVSRAWPGPAALDPVKSPLLISASFETSSAVEAPVPDAVWLSGGIEIDQTPASPVSREPQDFPEMAEPEQEETRPEILIRPIERPTEFRAEMPMP